MPMQRVKSEIHAANGRCNKGKKYNDVAQGKGNKTVCVVDAKATLADINTRVASVSAESDDPSPAERLVVNTPDWIGGKYQPGCDDVAEIFATAFNKPTDTDIDDDEFIEGLDDIPGPTAEELAAIEKENVAA